MTSCRVVSTGALPDWVQDELGNRFQLVVSDSPDPSRVREMLDERVAAIIARSSTPVRAEMIQAAVNLRAIGRTGVGYDSIDVQAATRRGIAVLYTPDALTRPTAEHTVALILGCAKQLRLWQQLAQQGKWQQRNRLLNRDLQGAVLGIVGLGRIGREVHKLLQPFEMKVLACDPLLDPGSFAKLGVQPVSLGELLSRSDIITLHAPLTETTRGLIHSGNIGTIRAGAILINAARGGLVESNAILWEALQSGRLAAVGLDALEEEPPELSDPLLSHPRALITAHVGSRTSLAQETVLRTLLGDLKAVLKGEAPTRGNLVNPEWERFHAETQRRGVRREEKKR